MDDNAKKVLSRLQAHCSRRECCSRDIYAKALKAMDRDSAVAEEIVESLRRDRYLDDLRYATAFARDKSSLQGWGPVKISWMLKAKGLDEVTISSALEEVDADSAERKLDSLVAQKRRQLEGDPQMKLKLLKYALGRGYGYDNVKASVERVLAKDGK